MPVGAPMIRTSRHFVSSVFSLFRSSNVSAQAVGQILFSTGASTGGAVSRESLFSNRHQAEVYAQFRPAYPPELYSEVYSFANLLSCETALDVATGSGQAAVELAKTFKKVYAIDPSKEQLAQAVTSPNIVYSVGTAEALGFAPSSIDLITVGNALHWFDLKAFYSECRRILRPHGCLAAWCYGLFDVPSYPKAHAALIQLHTEKLGQYWDERRKLVDSGYVDMEPSFPSEFKNVIRKTLTMESNSTLREVVGYVSSWSSYATFKRVHGNSLVDPVVEFERELKNAVGVEHDSVLRKHLTTL